MVGVDLSALLAEFARQQVNEVHVLRQGEIERALMAQGLVNEVVCWPARAEVLRSGRGLFGSAADGTCGSSKEIGVCMRSIRSAMACA